MKQLHTYGQKVYNTIRLRTLDVRLPSLRTYAKENCVLVQAESKCTGYKRDPYDR